MICNIESKGFHPTEIQVLELNYSNYLSLDWSKPNKDALIMQIWWTQLIYNLNYK